MKEHFIRRDNFHEAVGAFTKKIMKGNRGWRKDQNLEFLEFQIEGIIEKYLEGYGGIKFER